MRNRHKTIASLRRLAERPGTQAEGETARILLERMGGKVIQRRTFTESEFPRFTPIFYNYWAYARNQPGVIVGKKPRTVQGQTWIRIKFDWLKSVRSVPVTSSKGCHISKHPLPNDECDHLKHPYDEF